MTDTILCSDKADAKECVDAIGAQYIDDWEFLEDGKVRLFLTCNLEQIKKKNERQI